jgi:hypothetical protein
MKRTNGNILLLILGMGFVFFLADDFPLLFVIGILALFTILLVVGFISSVLEKNKRRRLENMSDSELKDCDTFINKLNNLADEMRELMTDIDANDSVSDSIRKYHLYYKQKLINRENGGYDNLITLVQMDLANLFVTLSDTSSRKDAETMTFVYLESECLMFRSMKTPFQRFIMDEYKGLKGIDLMKYMKLSEQNNIDGNVYLIGYLLKTLNSDLARRYYDFILSYANFLACDDDGNVPDGKQTVLDGIIRESKCIPLDTRVLV